VSVLFVLALGGMDVYEFCVPEAVPEPRNIGFFCEERELASRRDGWAKFDADPEANWTRLQPSLRVLRKVCPEAARWVEDRHATGHLVWATNRSDVYAMYDHINGTLLLSDSILTSNTGERAVTLAHEYRHSLQHSTKTLRRALFLAVTGHDHEAFVESDAYDFERQVRLAIFN
jgi:hypothetical protein